MAEGTAEKSHIHWTFCVSGEDNDKGQAREGEWAEWQRSEKPRIYALMLDRAASQRQSKLNLNLNELGDEGFMTQIEDNG